MNVNMNLETRSRIGAVEREAQAAQPARPETREVGVEVPAAGTARRSEFVNTRLSFGYDEQSGRVYVQIVRSDTGEVVRQRPPESMLEMLAQIREMIGLILDEKA